MEPLIFRKVVQTTDRKYPVVNGNLAMFTDTTGIRIHDSEIPSVDVLSIIENKDGILSHINNKIIHITEEERKMWTDYYVELTKHTANSAIHVTETEKAKWNNKETTEGSQTKANIVQSNLNAHINDASVHCTEVDRLTWFDKYTKAEIDNKFAMIEFNNDWKEAVQTYDDLAITYPDPYAGWTVNVLDSGITYRFDGEEWVGISANAIPLATHELDGLMSKEDKAKLDTVEENANFYEHPTDDGNIHVWNAWIEYWNDKADKVNATYNSNGLMSKEDKYKLDGIEEGATNYVEPEQFDPSKIAQNENNRFVTDAEKDYWSKKANNNLASENLDGLLSKSDKHKLNSVEFNANYYVHPTFHDATIITRDAEHRFVTDAQIIDWNSKAGVSEVTTTASGLMTKEDKAKLDTIEENANNYIHPEHHAPSIIAQDANNRFVTDYDIKNWNGKKDQDEIICGSGILNSTEGAVILHTMGGTNYAVNITFTTRPEDVGMLWVEKYNDSCVVKCTGTTRTVEFDYTLIKYYK